MVLLEEYGTGTGYDANDEGDGWLDRDFVEYSYRQDNWNLPFSQGQAGSGNGFGTGDGLSNNHTQFTFEHLVTNAALTITYKRI